MLDHKEEIFTSEKESILSRVEARIAAGTSLLRLHLETGIRQDHIQKLLKRELFGYDRYDRTDGVDEAIAAFSEWMQAVPAAHETPSSWAETPSFLALTNIHRITHKNALLTGITGPVGFGKTFSEICYAAENPRTHKRPGAIRIQFNKTDGKPSAALATILTALHGESSGSYRNGSLYQAVGARLRPGDYLMLDDCQRLGDAIDIVASLHDDFGIGISMTGNPDFSAAIWGKDRTFDALGSRILRHEFNNTTSEDVEVWIAWKGALEGLPVKERSALLKAAISIATRPGREGGLRTLAQIFDYAPQAYGNQPLTGPLLLVLAKQLKGGA